MIRKLKNKSHSYEVLKFEYSVKGVEELREFCPHITTFGKDRTPNATAFATLRYYVLDDNSQLEYILTNLQDGMYIAKVDGKFVKNEMFNILTEAEVMELVEDLGDTAPKIKDQGIFSAPEVVAITKKALDSGTEKTRYELKVIMEKILNAAENGRSTIHMERTTSVFVLHKLKDLGYKVSYTDNKRTENTLDIYW